MLDTTTTTFDTRGGPLPVAVLLSQLRPLMNVNTTHPAPLAGVLQLIADAIPAVGGAAISRRRSGHTIPRTIAMTTPSLQAVEDAQSRTGSGPVVDTIRHQIMVTTENVAQDSRWPRLVGPLAGIPPVAAVSVPVRDSHERVTALTLYGDAVLPPAALDQLPTVVAILEMALVGLAQHEHVVNLRLATNSNRRIGIAVGILMAHHLSTADEAFDALSTASQLLNRKVADLAEDVILTGALPA